MLTPEKIAELRELLAHATPGEWRLVYRDDDTRWERMAGVLKGDTVLEIGPVSSDDIFHYHSDAALIAAMKTALPDLLDKVEVAWRCYDSLKEIMEYGGSEDDALEDECVMERAHGALAAYKATK